MTDNKRAAVTANISVGYFTIRFYQNGDFCAKK